MTATARRDKQLFRWDRHCAGSGGCAIALLASLAVTTASSPAAAAYWYGDWHKHRTAHKTHEPKAADRVDKEPFGQIQKGPLQIFISINQQKLHLYSDGVHVADTSIATGVLSLPTPLGVFSVIQKQVFHRSTSTAMRRCLTCSASPGRASPCTKAKVSAIERRMAASVCRMISPCGYTASPSSTRA